MILKKILLNSSVAILICTLFNLNYVFAQFEIQDSSNFSLVYNSQIENDTEYLEYNFVGNFIVREWTSPDIDRVFKEPIIQILDLRDQSVYEYRPESQKLYNTTPPVQFDLDPNIIINKKDSSTNSKTYNYFLTKKENDFGNAPLISDVLFLTDLQLPNRYQIISEIYGGKNTLFPLYHSGIMFSSLTKEGSKTIYHLELESITKSDYSEDEMKNILKLLNE
jgi:predicted RNA-binding protein